MDWVLNHLQVIIAVAGAVAYWLSQRKPVASADVSPPGEQAFEDPELAERTRRIREEIQRKIEQRSRGYTPPPPSRAEPEPDYLPPILRDLVEMRQPEPPPRPQATAARLETQRNAEILEQQAALAEKLKQAKEMKAATQRRTQFETEMASKEELAKAEVRSAVGDDLRDPAALRRAFVLREILGPPVALR